MRRRMLAGGVLLFSLATSASALTFTPTPGDLKDLDHAMAYLWKVDWSPEAHERIVGASLTFHNIWDWAREDDILRIFADVSALFRRQPGEDADDPAALSAGQYFLTYLRTLDARGAGLPTGFVEALRRALRHYGSDELSVTPELKSRLLALYTSNQRAAHQAGMLGSDLMAVLGRDHEVSGVDVGEFDITSAPDCHRVIASSIPRWSSTLRHTPTWATARQTATPASLSLPRRS